MVWWMYLRLQMGQKGGKKKMMVSEEAEEGSRFHGGE